jgi:hypothetical protein
VLARGIEVSSTLGDLSEALEAAAGSDHQAFALAPLEAASEVVLGLVEG